MDLLHYVRPFCVTSPYILLGLVIFHLGIGISYTLIAYTLRYILTRSGPITGGGHVRDFQHFVGACGGTHFLAVAILFIPDLDWWYVWWLAVTLVLSASTAVKLWCVREFIVALFVDRDKLIQSVRKLNSDANRTYL